MFLTFTEKFFIYVSPLRLQEGMNYFEELEYEHTFDTITCNDCQHLTGVRHILQFCTDIYLMTPIWTTEVLTYQECPRNTLFLCVRNMTIYLSF